MKRQSIGLTLAISFGFLVCVLLGLGWLGLSRMGRIHADLEELVMKRWAKVQLYRAALNYSNLNSRLTMEVFLLGNPDQIPPLLQQRAANSEKISVLLSRIQAQGIEPGKERELLDAIVAARTPYVASYQQAIHQLKDEHQYAQARTAMVERTLPLLVRYHDAWNNFLEFQGQRIDEAATESRSRYAGAHRAVVSLILLAASLCGIIGFSVTRLMTKEIDRRASAEQEVSTLNAGLEQKVAQRTQEFAIANIDLEKEITERKNTEVSSHAAKEAAEDADRGKSIFLANMSHEIRTPMNGIPAIHLRRNQMTSGAVFLLCGVFLVATLPVCADSLFYTGAASDAPNTENSAPEIPGSALKLVMPVTADVMPQPLATLVPAWSDEFAFLGFAAERSNNWLSAHPAGMSFLTQYTSQFDGRLSKPTPAMPSIGGFEPSSAFAAWGSGPSFVAGTVSPPSSDLSAHSIPPSDFSSGDSVLSLFDSEGARHRIGRERGKGNDGKNQDQPGSAPLTVPEPAALPLLLSGLAAIGVLARRRNLFPTTT
jgi:signal transduction histidine kinase